MLLANKTHWLNVPTNSKENSVLFRECCGSSSKLTIFIWPNTLHLFVFPNKSPNMFKDKNMEGWRTRFACTFTVISLWKCYLLWDQFNNDLEKKTRVKFMHANLLLFYLRGTLKDNEKRVIHIEHNCAVTWYNGIIIGNQSG